LCDIFIRKILNIDKVMYLTILLKFYILA